MEFNMSDDIIQLKQKDVKALRIKLHEEQNMICPVCNQYMPHEDMTLDHQHKLFKDQPLLEDGAGMVRGAICKLCNSWEGKVTNSFKRMGLHKKDGSFAELLRNLADYIEQDNLPMIHYSEEQKRKKLSKRCFKTLLKEHTKRKPKNKPLVYPKSGFLTKGLETLFIEYGIPIVFNK
jgi:hypothetical protein